MLEIKDVKATLSFTLMYGEFHVKIQNTHDKKLSFTILEKNGSKGWVELPPKAVEYILIEFKKSEEYQKIKKVFEYVLKDYGY